MKHLLILLTLFLFGFDHIKSIQDSFGFIKTYYAVQADPNYQCTTCLTYSKDLELLSILNNEFKKTPYIKASAFVIKKIKDKTLLSTSYHVCESLKEFQNEKKFKDLGDKLMKDAFTSSLFLNTEITKQYKLRPKMSVLEFDGTLHNIENIVYENPDNDVCFLETKDSWGKEIEFTEKTCYYEKIYNISASGGYYKPSASVLREGYVNNKVKETDIDDRTFKDHMLYTLYVLPGASGSGVFNVKGKLCGNVNISYAKIGVSFGASSEIIQNLLKNFLNSPLGSSYALKE
tara:strand:- start:913 stop:1779 length:867 start_codon:yes stop_codon:yes gene_type:complete